jgi:hypothetical protein
MSGRAAPEVTRGLNHPTITTRAGANRRGFSFALPNGRRLKSAYTCLHETCQNAVTTCRDVKKSDSGFTLCLSAFAGVLEVFRRNALNGLANRRFRPLSHLSVNCLWDPGTSSSRCFPDPAVAESLASVAKESSRPHIPVRIFPPPITNSDMTRTQGKGRRRGAAWRRSTIEDRGCSAQFSNLFSGGAGSSRAPHGRCDFSASCSSVSRAASMAFAPG